MNILITGAQFNNKGAQSLLFSLISELYERLSDVNIFYIPLDSFFEYKQDEYRFFFVFDDMSAQDFKEDIFLYAKRKIKNFYEKGKIAEEQYLSKIIKKIDAMIDISGYQLTSKAAKSDNRRYIRYIKEANKRNIPVILLPQSFGPFDYNDSSFIIEAKEALHSVRIIFCRESSGYNLLKEQFGLENLRFAPDLVLQTSVEKISNIYKNENEIKTLRIGTKANVGIVPNEQTLVHGQSEHIIFIYKKIIEFLVENGKEVYIFRHSNDLKLCEEIYAMFYDDSRVHIIKDEMNCLEYSCFVQQFDFIVASRYHAIIHAYKKNVPTVILGWADKYFELARLMNQEEYVEDITKPNVDVSYIIGMVNRMSIGFENEKKKIDVAISKIKKNSAIEESLHIIRENCHYDN